MAARPDPAVTDVERAFADAMKAAGFMPGPIQTDTDNFVRFDAPGDKKGKGNGFYKLITGRWPVGWFGDWKAGEQHEWSWHQHVGETLSEADRKAMKRESRRLKAEADQARELKQAEVAEEASRMWGRSATDVEGHPYLVAKRIEVPRGLRIYTAKDSTRLLAVPMWQFDLNGQPKLINLQLIDGHGKKTFLKAGRVSGTFFSIKGDSATIVICEGVATAFSIWKATGLSAVAAFNGGNLIEVAREFSRWRPLATLLIAGDDDVFAPDDWAEKTGGKPWRNTGALKAEAAAKAVGCRYILPVFSGGPDRSRTDFNDLHLLEGEQAVAGQIIGAFRSVEAEDAAPGAQVVDIAQVQDESWRSQIPRTSSGTLDGSNVEGVRLYIAHHRLLTGRLRFNMLTREMELDGNPLEDHNVAEFRRLMHSERFKAKKGDVQDEMEAEARRNQFDPLLDYLAGLKWDGKKRIDLWLHRYLGVPDTDYCKTVGRRFLIGAVARAHAPPIGLKLDTMLVLEGPQGLGKSTALRYLFGDRFFVDELPDFHSKDSFLQLQGSWCVEVAELSALSKADVKDVKKFLSRLVDKYRPPYGRNPVQVPRRNVFAGTVNPEEGGYLRDPTGNRRFWPVECREVVAGMVDLSGILSDRDQLWAEALTAFRQGERWHLAEQEIQDAEAEQEARREKDPWEETIAAWLDEGARREVTCGDVLAGAIKMPAEKQEARHSRRIGAVMRALRWEPGSARIGSDKKPSKVFRHPEYAAEIRQFDYEG